jgi:hypothetical protein
MRAGLANFDENLCAIFLCVNCHYFLLFSICVNCHYFLLFSIFLREPSQLLNDLTMPEGKASGLHVASAVTCPNLLTVHENRIHKRIGRLPPSAMGRIDGCLRAALAL